MNNDNVPHWVESGWRVVRADEDGSFAIMNIGTRHVFIDNLTKADLLTIMEGCSKWLDEIETETAEEAK